MVDLEPLISAIVAHRFRYVSEAELQEGLAQVLAASGFGFSREHALSRADRIDFLVGTVGLEVKIDGGLSEVTRQVHRYLKYAELEGLVLVTTRAMHQRLPTTILGKPVGIAYLSPL